jgi:hypothetical protein
MSHERPDNDWWCMALYGGTGFDDPCYQGDSTKGSNKGPSPADDVSDTLAGLITITQEPRDRLWQPVYSRKRDEWVYVLVDVEIEPMKCR